MTPPRIDGSVFHQVNLHTDFAHHICAVHKKLYDLGFSVGNDGNSSIKIDNDHMWITPAGLEKAKLLPQHISKISISSGKLVEGDFPPSTEWKLHAEIYKHNPKVGAIVHSHPPYSIACSLAGISLDEPVLPELVLSLGSVETCEYICPGTQTIALQAAKALGKGRKAIILERHGVVAVGQSIQEALIDLERVEHAARILLLARSAGNIAPLSQTQLKELQQSIL
ncbi:MAG: class II aldolase/adducin family protein [Bdellovibrionota bacterium]